MSFDGISNVSQREEVERITNYIFDKFKKETFSQVDILYPKFLSLAEQEPSFVQFLPFEFKPTKEKSYAKGLPIFEPTKEKIFSELLRKYIGIFFYKIVMEVRLSEFSARTVAMEHATVKTENIVKRLTLDYAKHRRRTATKRQLESFIAHKII